MRRVDEPPDDADSEDRRSEGGACSSGGEQGPHLRARASAGARGSSGRRARTPRRGRVTERVGDLQGASARRVDEAPEAEDGEDSSVEGGSYPTGGEEGPHQPARASAGERDISGRRAAANSDSDALVFFRHE